jgi:hypothetical protein
VVAGSNEELKASAEEAARSVPQPVTVYGFVNNIHELMDAADLIVSKPGGLTTSEVLAKGKPMLIIDPIPGQEQRNCEVLLEAGAAARLFDIEDAGDKIRDCSRQGSLGPHGPQRREDRPPVRRGRHRGGHSEEAPEPLELWGVNVQGVCAGGLR